MISCLNSNNIDNVIVLFLSYYFENKTINHPVDDDYVSFENCTFEDSFVCDKTFLVEVISCYNIKVFFKIFPNVILMNHFSKEGDGEDIYQQRKVIFV